MGSSHLFRAFILSFRFEVFGVGAAGIDCFDFRAPVRFQGYGLGFRVSGQHRGVSNEKAAVGRPMATDEDSERNRLMLSAAHSLETLNSCFAARLKVLRASDNEVWMQIWT